VIQETMMRALYLSLPGLLLWAVAALGQQGAPPVAAKPDPRLDATLAGWEKAMTELTSFKVEKCVRKTVDKTFNAVDLYEGEALFLKGVGKQPSRASLELRNLKKPTEIYEKYVCSGTFLYEFAPASKEVRVHTLPPQKEGQVGEENFLQFLFGMKSAEAKARYNMIYVPATDANQAKYYHFLRILPKLPQDKADFAEARLVLMAATFLPAQLWYLQPNGNEITWDFPKVTPNANIPIQAFEVNLTRLPQGWTARRIEARNLQSAAPPPPTVVRPQNR
jgi:TIGR03009 family protein